MGTPVLIRAREEQCVGAGKCFSRELTDEEKLKYASIKPLKEKPVVGVLASEFLDMEVEEMKGVKINPPEKEKLLGALAGVRGKTKAVYAAAKIYKVSAPVVFGWVRDYGIQFDDAGMVIRESVSEEVKQEVPEAAGDSITDDTEAIQAGTTTIPKGGLSEEFLKYNNDKPTDTITITGQETKEIYHHLGYAEYDIGTAVIQIDFRKELVNIGACDNEGTPSEGPISFEEAIAAAELILDILGHE